MKRFVLISMLGAYFSSILIAQEAVKFGLAGGMNVSKTSSSVFSSRVGFHAGVKSEIGLSKLASGLYCEAGALLSLKGEKVDWGDLGYMSMNPFYLEVPVRIGYKYAVNDNFKVVGKLGPYFALGLFGKETDSYGPGDTETYNLFTGPDAINRFDAGIGLNFGIEILNKYQLFVGNDWGLLPIYKNDSDAEIDLGSGVKNVNLTISLSYLF